MDDRLLTTEEVMQFFKVSKRTLQNWVDERRIPQPIMIGGLNRWKNSDIQKFVFEIKPKEG